jgi:hypothetical protein
MLCLSGRLGEVITREMPMSESWAAGLFFNVMKNRQHPIEARRFITGVGFGTGAQKRPNPGPAALRQIGGQMEAVVQ